MARSPLNDRNVRKLSRVGRGRTMSVTLPIELVRELKWRETQKVVITKRGDSLIIKDWEG